MNLKDSNLRVCIVGAGPAGLSMARALKSLGIEYQQFEKHTGLGGIWDIDNPGTPMYESAHFISSRSCSGYYGFPMPAWFAEYPTREQVLEYTKLFASNYDLLPDIKFDHGVQKIEKVSDGWLVETDRGNKEKFSHIVCASGTTWDKNVPDYPGAFNGTEIHSVDYVNHEAFRGKKVLIVGAGNSACDIACDAAQVAEAASISMRRGYHFIPKHIFGKPADEFGERARAIPFCIRQSIFGRLLKLINGDLERYGLKKPDHKVFESHPIVNSQLLHYLSHGDIQARGDIDSLNGDSIIFRDGTSEDIDIVIYATGYKHTIPYLDTDYFEWEADRPVLGHTVFNPKHDSLFALGFTEMNSGGYYIFDEMSALVAQAIETQARKPIEWEQQRLKLIGIRSFSGGINLVSSGRHVNYLDIETFLKKTRKTMRQMNWKSAQKLVNN